MDLASTYFSLFALVAIGCSLGVLVSRHPIAGAINLVGLMISLAGIFGILGGPFNGTIQILVYAGAIMMLVVFVIMVLNSAKDHVIPRWDLGALLGLSLPLLFAVMVLYTISQVGLGDGKTQVRGTVEDIAARLFDFSSVGGAYHILFLLVSLVLLVALVGAVLLAKRQLDYSETAIAVEHAEEGDEHHG